MWMFNIKSFIQPSNNDILSYDIELSSQMDKWNTVFSPLPIHVKMKMESFSVLLHLLLILLLQLTSAQNSSTPDEGGDKVLEFYEVWTKSMCRPVEQFVDIEQELPGLAGHFFLPACVLLWRCSGCCGDEGLECSPLKERNVTLQVKRIVPLISSQLTELTFVEHESCECRIRPTQKSERNTESVMKKPWTKKHKTTNNCSR
ncbi:vascular endothelial growth factor A-like isoform X1 [Cynoglossus semilaevis]|nr:vascular endothelial growth factor A-like isoform X1 [Cynoglossus semilaevis]